NRIRVERAQQLRHGSAYPGALGRLLAADVHEFVRRNVIRQDHVAATEQNRRPDDGMKRDVVLADEVILAAGRVLPPALPGVRLACIPGPLDSRRKIAATRLEPHVDAPVVPTRSNL